MRSSNVVIETEMVVPGVDSLPHVHDNTLLLIDEVDSYLLDHT